MDRDILYRGIVGTVGLLVGFPLFIYGAVWSVPHAFYSGTAMVIAGVAAMSVDWST